ncbi:MAG: AraC family ligand binding domain-containing protein [Deltaproteobacteria bacterium]|nr:AraC family ligand binding domain-containing protein [Deltaproteobacteria bacterium]
MTDRPYITYPAPRAFSMTPAVKKELTGTLFVNEPGQVSFGANDFSPGLFRALHGHHTWELIIIDGSSAGPGYTYFDGRWWRVDPGASVFVPKKCPHAWSSGNTHGFRMLWIYGGSREESGRIWYVNPEEARGISPEEEKDALVWTPEAAGAVPAKS